MKKSLIAGAGIAALGLAVVPFAGVFAADITTMTDTINVTVADVCTFDAASHSYTKAMTANTTADIDTTTMKVTCNNHTGYEVTGAYTALTGNGTNKISFGESAPTAGTSSWAASAIVTIDGGSPAAAAYLKNNGTVMSNTKQTVAAGDTAAITYKAGTSNNIAAGTYTGTATYTLTNK